MTKTTKEAIKGNKKDVSNFTVLQRSFIPSSTKKLLESYLMTDFFFNLHSSLLKLSSVAFAFNKFLQNLTIPELKKKNASDLVISICQRPSYKDFLANIFLDILLQLVYCTPIIPQNVYPPTQQNIFLFSFCI